jgi:hypothetical protein
MSISVDSRLPCFGFGTEQEIKSLTLAYNISLSGDYSSAADAQQDRGLTNKSLAQQDVKLYNMTKVFACLPITGQIVGAYRIYKNGCDSDLPLSERVQHIVRGVGECLFLGIFFVIADLIVQIFRSIPTSQKVQ